jgi:hypothetical protein
MVLRLACTTSGPLGSHRDIKKGRRECGAAAHREGETWWRRGTSRRHSGKGGAVPTARRAAPKRRGAPRPARGRKREAGEGGRRWLQMGKNRAAVTWLTDGGNGVAGGGQMAL